MEAYLAPNDEAENDRLDMHHHLAALLIGGRLTTAPIESNVQRILDVGCGTGIWSIDMGEFILSESLCEATARLTMTLGDEYPSAQILGVDLSPTQPNMYDSLLNLLGYEEKIDYF